MSTAANGENTANKPMFSTTIQWRLEPSKIVSRQTQLSTPMVQPSDEICVKSNEKRVHFNDSVNVYDNKNRYSYSIKMDQYARTIQHIVEDEVFNLKHNNNVLANKLKYRDQYIYKLKSMMTLYPLMFILLGLMMCCINN